MALYREFHGINGEVVTGVTPTQIVNQTPDVEISSENHTLIAHAYKLFRDAVRTALPGFLVQHRTYPNGMRLRLESNNGQDRVLVWVEGGEALGVEDALYMDTGDLVVRFPGTMNPNIDPAKLLTIDIDTSWQQRWIGEAYVAVFWKKTKELIGLASTKLARYVPDFVKHLIPLGAQTKNQRLNRPIVNNMDSYAIGYKQVKTALELQEQKDRWGGVLVLKKLMMGAFPASLFTGKMRLFMQAQYGRPAFAKDWHFSLNFGGASLVLQYSYDEDGETYIWQPGFWAHSTPGLMSTPDGGFFIIDIRGGPTYTIDAYPLVPINDSAKALMAAYRRYKQGGSVPEFFGDGYTSGAQMSKADEAKVEAYIFAYSKIDLRHKRRVGSYTTFGDAAISGALYYGWKFNSTGMEASIVLASIAGAMGDHYITSATLKLIFTYTPINGQAPSAARISVEGETTNHSPWIDGWGAYNIFTPTDMVSGPLEAFSLMMQAGTFSRSIPNFSNVHIYGYYHEDVWTPCVISKTTPDGPFPKHTCEYSGMTPGVGLVVTPEQDQPQKLCYMNPLEPADVKNTYTYESVSMDIAMGAFSYAGQSKTVEEDYWHREYLGTFSTQANQVDFVTSSFGWGYTPSSTSVASGTFMNTGCLSSGSTVTVGRASISLKSYSGTVQKNWTFVIPSGDCEAAYIATRDESRSGSFSTKATQISNSVVGFTGDTHTCFDSPGMHFDFVPWTVAETVNSWYGIDPGVENIIEPADPIPTPTTSVVTFNRKDAPGSAAPGGSYYALFYVARDYPFYDRGMTMSASYDKRLYGSEHVKTPDAMRDETPRFVGWA